LDQPEREGAERGVRPGASAGLLASSERSGGLPRALRSRARHLAMLTLYTKEVHGFATSRKLPEMLRWLCKDPPRRARARAVVEAALADRSRLDSLLDRAVTDWRLERLGAIERASMRAAGGEILLLGDAPAGAVINDAVELARRYGEEASPGFVNAVLTNFVELPEVAAELAAGSTGDRGVDLHTHSSFSDGDLSPAELVGAAREAGLAGIALTDHDEVRGIDPALAAGGEQGLEVVPGVELTSYLGSRELHILGLFIDHRDDRLCSELERFREGRRQRAVRICEKLTGLGAALRPEEVYRLAGDGAIGRPHIARALVGAGHCSSTGEAFRRFIGDGRPAWAAKVRITPAEAIELVHAAGGLAFLAHPGTTGCDQALPGLVEAGIDGLETRHSLHPEPVCRHYQRWVHRRDLLSAGGSDFHGPTLEDRPLGSPFVPASWMIGLRNHWRLRRAAEAAGAGAGAAGSPTGAAT
jgi:transcription antitermination factor NusB